MRLKYSIALFTAVLLLSAPAFTARGMEWPRPDGPVADYAGLIQEQARKKITGLCLELEQRTGAALVVATLPTLGDMSIEEAAVKIFEDWGIGQKGKDNGILLLVAKEQRRMRIEVGYGLEGVITDATAGRVRDQAIMPYFKKGDFGTGIWLGMARLATIINGGEMIEPAADSPSRHSSRPMSKGMGLLGVLAALALALLALHFSHKGKAWGGRGSGGGSSSGGFGGFGGGFGGFGGGMSGGGGVSGGW